MPKVEDEDKPGDECPGCGGPVACGMANGEETCWCFALPPALPIPATEPGACCYCPSCLERMIDDLFTPTMLKTT